MDIPRLPELSPTSGRRNAPAAEIFKQLTQLGSIQARVAMISQGQAILLTQLGQITTTNALNLKAGDIIQVRSNGNEQNPVIKVNTNVDSTVVLESIKHTALSKIIPSGSSAKAILVSQQNDGARIKIGTQIFVIPRQANIKPGQILSLVRSDKSNSIEIKAIDHRQVLKSAINKLLPQQTVLRENSGLTQLVTLAQTLSKSLPDFRQQGALPKPSAATRKFPAGLPTSTNTIQSKTAPSPIQNSTPNLLQTLLASVPTISKLDKSTLAHWSNQLLTSLSSQKPGYQASMQQLLQQMPKTEGTLVQFLQKITQQITAQQQSNNAAHLADANKAVDESLQLIARDIIKLVEQSNNQQLLQQTSLRYQQELQQPLVLNLTIPIREEQKTRELRLKIRQKNHTNELHKQCWDIHFDFEFGLLGMISTHLVLDENTLSASFWSELIDTQSKIENGLDDFKQQINRAGFDLGQFHNFAGKPPAYDEENMVPSSESLLDIRV